MYELGINGMGVFAVTLLRVNDRLARFQAFVAVPLGQIDAIAGAPAGILRTQNESKAAIPFDPPHQLVKPRVWFRVQPGRVSVFVLSDDLEPVLLSPFLDLLALAFDRSVAFRGCAAVVGHGPRAENLTCRVRCSYRRQTVDGRNPTLWRA